MADLPLLISVALFFLAAACGGACVAVLAFSNEGMWGEEDPRATDDLAISAWLAVLAIVFAFVAGVLL
jgi:hypothetical protein